VANKHPDLSHLKPVRTKEEATKRGRNGGKKSGIVRREKKLLSQIYAEALAESNNIDGNGKSLKDVVKELLSSGNVPMFKEAREATEGSKVALMNPDGSDILSKGITVKFVDAK
jgi:hypothetical protein